MVVPVVVINLRELAAAPVDATILKTDSLSVTVTDKGSFALSAIASSTINVIPFNCKSRVLAASSLASVDMIVSIVRSVSLPISKTAVPLT